MCTVKGKRCLCQADLSINPGRTEISWDCIEGNCKRMNDVIRVMYYSVKTRAMAGGCTTYWPHSVAYRLTFAIRCST